MGGSAGGSAIESVRVRGEQGIMMSGFDGSAALSVSHQGMQHTETEEDAVQREDVARGRPQRPTHVRIVHLNAFQNEVHNG